MDTAKYNKNLEYLIDKWCDRKELNSLRCILNGKASLNGLSDGWERMLTELKSIRFQYRDKLEGDELDIIVELIHTTESVLNK